MGNRKSPKDFRVSARVSGKTKRQLEKLPYSCAEVIAFGAEYMSNELNRLEVEKGELELEIAEIKSELYEREANLTAINNRIRCINPDKLDDETLATLIGDAAKEYADKVYDKHKENSLERIRLPKISASVRRLGKEWGYDPTDFFDLVEDNLKLLCMTSVSDISARDLEENV